MLPVVADSRDDTGRVGIGCGEAEGRRLEHGQRGELRHEGGRAERDDGPVRMSTEMVPGPHAFGDPGRLVLEVDPLFGRIRREPGLLSTTSS
jgi:hypothetical protein